VEIDFYYRGKLIFNALEFLFLILLHRHPYLYLNVLASQLAVYLWPKLTQFLFNIIPVGQNLI